MKNRKNLIINVVLYALFHALKVFFFQSEELALAEMFNSKVIVAAIIAVTTGASVILHYLTIACFFFAIYAIQNKKITFQEAKDMSERCVNGYFFVSLSTLVLFAFGKGDFSTSIYAMFGYIPYYALSITNCYKNVLNDKWEKGKRILFVLLYAVVIVLLTIPGGMNE